MPAEAQYIPSRSTSSVESPPSAFLLRRDGDRDLSFNGWLIGFAEHGREEDRGVAVSIYGTESEKLVMHACRWETYGGKKHYDCNTKVFGIQSWEIGDALDWLKKDAGGKLGQTSKAAWEEACENFPTLRGEEVESI